MTSRDGVVDGPFSPAPEEREAVLDLCSLASGPYDAFVWDSEERARTVARLLWDAGVGEVTPSTSRVWRDAAGIVAVLVALDGRALQRARLRGAMTLSRAQPFNLSAAERARATLAAPALLSVPSDDAYLARIAIHPRARGRGLARRIMLDFASQAGAARAAHAWLEVQADNTTAIALYVAAGFEPLTSVDVSSSDSRELRFLHMRMPVHTGV